MLFKLLLLNGVNEQRLEFVEQQQGENIVIYIYTVCLYKSLNKLYISFTGILLCVSLAINT